MQLYKAWYSVIHWCCLEGARASRSNQPPRVRHTARRRGGIIAARGARAAPSDFVPGAMRGVFA